MAHTSQTRLVMKLTKSDTAIETQRLTVISNGPKTLEFSTDVFATNRDRLIEIISRKMPGKPVVVLQGGDLIPIYDTDVYYPFQQESFFMWAFGVTVPGCYGVIDINTKTSYLFVPRPDKVDSIWKGRALNPKEYIKKYQVHNVHYVEDLYPVVRGLSPTVLLTLNPSRISYLEARFPGVDKFAVDNNTLYDEMAELRVHKTDGEIEILEYVNKVSSEAMRNVMRFAEPGKTEYQCEVEFMHYCYSVGGSRNLAFHSICASNGNAAYTNYTSSAGSYKVLEAKETCVLNMGASYFGYCADIAVTFPIQGKFQAKQKYIYEIILSISTTIIGLLKPGIHWEDVQALAHRILLTELKRGGLVKGDVEQMVGAGLGSVFHPQGIGHFIGLDVHDVGGFIGVQPSEVNFCTTLRTTRKLEERMVITVAPGCYFNDYLLNSAMDNVVLNRFMNIEIIKKYKSVGGMKIEDNVLITKKGAVNLTKVPRTVDDIEAWMAGKDIQF